MHCISDYLPPHTPFMHTEDKEALKLMAASAALEFVVSGSVLGVGSGSTVSRFISLLKPMASSLRGAVAASESSATALREAGIEVLDLNAVDRIQVYVDGADEIDPQFAMIKGGGAALTREKIIGSAAETFVCIVDQSKVVERLGAFPLPIEVVPMAVRSVGRSITALGGTPRLRPGVVTDNGNSIVDVTGLSFADPVALESELNQLPGVVCNGVFARRPADVCIVASHGGVAIRRRWS